LGVIIIEAIAAETTQESPNSTNTQLGWEDTSKDSTYSIASSHTIEEFERITATKQPVTPEPPLTYAELELISHENAAGNVPEQLSIENVESQDVSEVGALAVEAQRRRLRRRYYDDFTIEECREQDPIRQMKEWVSVGKNRFSWCAARVGPYGFRSKDKEYRTWFRTTVLGRGFRGPQRMVVELHLDDFHSTPPIPRLPLDTLLTVHLYCHAAQNGICHSSDPDGRTDTIAGWMRNGTYSVEFDTSNSPGGGDLKHFDRDKVSYHDIEIRLSGEGGTMDKHVQPFRCDGAPYASGGGCIFHEVTPTLHYSLTSEDHAEVAEHIQFAQDLPEETVPLGAPWKMIPGKPGSGKPLNRLYANYFYYDPSLVLTSGLNGLHYYRKNRNIVRYQCRRRKASLPPMETKNKQCDEYPFASTYQGAYFQKANQGQNSIYSIRFVDAKQNNNAGQYLKYWYRADHILAMDMFYVQIDP
jgi:hypothetical protein